MRATALGLHSARAVRDALRARGWGDNQSDNAAGGLVPLAFHLEGLDAAALEALVPFAGRLGLEVLTGDGWAVLSGSRARLGAFARPWTVPPDLAEAAMAIGLAMPAEPVALWRTARGAVSLDEPVVVGILNVTPDSFSDGGRHATLDAALAHAERLVAEGAAVLDVGGESTRPGAQPVPAAEEHRRIVPVIEALVRRLPAVPVSVDTTKADVARAALDAGAAAINDVSAFRLDPAMAGVVAAAGAGAILMHSRGAAMGELASYRHARYDDVVAEVSDELRVARDAALGAGVAEEAIVLDPGFGFSKTVEQNIFLLDQLAALGALGRPLLVGPSRKRFLGAVTGAGMASPERPDARPDDRDRVTATACALAHERGARLFRVHDVAAAREALALARALTGSMLSPTSTP